MDSPRKSSNVELHVKFTIVLPSPSARSSHVHARPLLYPFYTSYKAPPTQFDSPITKSRLVYRIVPDRIRCAESQLQSQSQEIISVMVARLPSKTAASCSWKRQTRVAFLTKYPLSLSPLTQTGKLAPPYRRRRNRVVLLKPQGPISVFSATRLLHPRSGRLGYTPV